MSECVSDTPFGEASEPIEVDVEALYGNVLLRMKEKPRPDLLEYLGGYSW